MGTEIQEFQLIFLNMDEKVTNDTDDCEDSTPDAESFLHSETEADRLVATIGNYIEEMIMKNIEDNAAGTGLSDSLEDVITMLDAFQLDMTSNKEAIETSTELVNTDKASTSQIPEELLATETNELRETTMSTREDETTTVDVTTKEDATTTEDEATTEEVTTTEDETNTEVVDTDTTTEVSEIVDKTTTELIDEDKSLLGRTLSNLKTANLTKTDEQILFALLELEELRGE